MKSAEAGGGGALLAEEVSRPEARQPHREVPAPWLLLKIIRALHMEMWGGVRGAAPLNTRP